MLISMLLYIAAVLVALIVDCKIGAIIYAVGIAVDILVPVIGSMEVPGAIYMVIGYAIGGSTIQIISLVLLLVGIPYRKKYVGQAKYSRSYINS